MALHNLYDQYGSGVRQPSTNSLHTTLLLILDGFSDAYVIVDALDECVDRIKLLNWVEEMNSWKVGKLHLLATSRPERDIESKLQPLGPISICLEGETVDLDIATYLDRMLEDKKGTTAWNHDAHIRKIVKTSLLHGAHGMYDRIHTESWMHMELMARVL